MRSLISRLYLQGAACLVGVLVIACGGYSAPRFGDHLISIAAGQTVESRQPMIIGQSSGVAECRRCISKPRVAIGASQQSDAADPIIVVEREGAIEIIDCFPVPTKAAEQPARWDYILLIARSGGACDDL